MTTSYKIGYTMLSCNQHKNTLIIKHPFWSNPPHIICHQIRKFTIKHMNFTFITLNPMLLKFTSLNVQQYNINIKAGVTFLSFKQILPAHDSTTPFFDDVGIFFCSFPLRLKPSRKHCWTKIVDTITPNSHDPNEVTHNQTILIGNNSEKVPSLQLLARKSCIGLKEISNYAHNIPICAEKAIQLIDGDIASKKKSIHCQHDLTLGFQQCWGAYYNSLMK